MKALALILGLVVLACLALAWYGSTLSPEEVAAVRVTTEARQARREAERATRDAERAASRAPTQTLAVPTATVPASEPAGGIQVRDAPARPTIDPPTATAAQTTTVPPTATPAPSATTLPTGTPAPTATPQPTETLAPTATPPVVPTALPLALPYTRDQVQNRFGGLTFTRAADVVEPDGSAYKRTAAEDGLRYVEVIGPDAGVLEVHTRVPIYYGDSDRSRPSFDLMHRVLAAATRDKAEYDRLNDFVMGTFPEIDAASAEDLPGYDTRLSLSDGRYVLVTAIFADEGVLYLLTVSTMPE